MGFRYGCPVGEHYGLLPRDQEWVSGMGALLESIMAYYSGVLDPILGFRVSIGYSLRVC
jgi:type II secretory pathway component PulM